MDTCMCMAESGLSRCLDGKESTHNAEATGDVGSIPELGKIPGGGHGNPLQDSCLENLREQRNLVGCSPWGHKESA